MPKRKVDSEGSDEADLFISFDDEVSEMRERMDRIFDAFMRNELGPDRAPSVYGFSVQRSADEEPFMREVDRKPSLEGTADNEPEAREPLLDVIESDDVVRVIVELPGLRKEDIKINVTGRLLDIDVDNEFKQFHEQVDLPCGVRPDSVKAGYKNGVLEISMKRAAKRKKGRQVPVD